MIRNSCTRYRTSYQPRQMLVSPKYGQRPVLLWKENTRDRDKMKIGKKKKENGLIVCLLNGNDFFYFYFFNNKQEEFLHRIDRNREWMRECVWKNGRKSNEYVRLTSITSTLLFGGIRFVLLAMQTKRAFTCCRPMFGYDKWFTVTPSGRCSNDSSITVLSKYHVTFGRGRP